MLTATKDQLISGVNSPIKNKDYLLQCQSYRHDMLTATKEQLISGVNSQLRIRIISFNVNRTDMTCVISDISAHDFTNPDCLHFPMSPNIK